jgi:hypothetical protein
MKLKIFLLFLVFSMISCKKYTDIYAPSYSIEELNGFLNINFKDEEGLSRININVFNTTWNKLVLDTIVLISNKNDFSLSKKLPNSGNHLTTFRVSDINGNWVEKKVNGYYTFEPKLKALVLKEITNNGANFKSTIINNGGRNITALGFCYSESNNPTVNNNKINNLIVNIGDFYSGFFVLKPNTKYYIRSFAANSEGLAYSNEFAFTTMK